MSNPWKPLRRVLLAILVLGFAACEAGDAPNAPESGDLPYLTVNGVQLVKIQAQHRLTMAGQSEVKLVPAKDGQTLSTDDAKLYVLAGSIAEDVVITMEAATDGTMSFKFGPSGLTFDPAAILEIKADKAELAGVDLSRLAVAGASDHVDDWRVIPGAVYDPDDNKITVPISHFSRYALCIE